MVLHCLRLIVSLRVKLALLSAQSVHGLAFGELDAGQTSDEHAAHEFACFLHRFEYWIDAGETARERFPVDYRLRDDPVSFQQRLHAGYGYAFGAFMILVPTSFTAITLIFEVLRHQRP